MTEREAWQLGYDEGDGCIGMTFNDDPDDPLSVAYDSGRAQRQQELGLD